MSVASKSAADMLDVGWPEPALVLARIESTRSCCPSSRIMSSPGCVVPVMVTIDMQPLFLELHRPVRIPDGRDCLRWIGTVPGLGEGLGGACISKPGGAHNRDLHKLVWL